MTSPRTHRSDLAALRHFEGSVGVALMPYPRSVWCLRHSHRPRLWLGVVSQTHAPRHCASPKRPSSIISASSTDLHSKGAHRSACGSAPAPERTTCLASRPNACLHCASRGPAATVQPQLPSAHRSIHLCTICLPLSGSSRCSTGEEMLLAGNALSAGWQPMHNCPSASPADATPPPPPPVSACRHWRGLSGCVRESGPDGAPPPSADCDAIASAVPIPVPAIAAHVRFPARAVSSRALRLRPEADAPGA